MGTGGGAGEKAAGVTLDQFLDGQGSDLQKTDKPDAQAIAYRTRLQAIADYVNAYPVPGWPPFAIGVGATLNGAASTVLVTTSGKTAIDIVAAIVLYLLGTFLVAFSVAIMRDGDVERQKRFREGRQLFFTWAKRIKEPYKYDDSVIGWTPSNPRPNYTWREKALGTTFWSTMRLFAEVGLLIAVVILILLHIF